MAANELNFNQVSTLLNQVQEQATGQKAITATNTKDFVACATTTLKTGYDNVFNAISQVLGSTIFSVRPYSRKFKGLENTELGYHNHTRKLAVADLGSVESDPYKWPSCYDSAKTGKETGNGESVDQYPIRKNKVLQTNVYGQNVYSDHYTIFRDQLDVAFKSPDEMARFWSMLVQNHSDLLEQWREDTARACLVNFIGGVIDEGQEGRVVHLLTEYNALNGGKLTAKDVYKPENFANFMSFVAARIGTISQMMTERSVQYQTTVKGLIVPRHTPVTDQRLFVLTSAMKYSQAMAMPTIFHDNMVNAAQGIDATEYVNFWQSIKTPDSINVEASRIGTDGTVTTKGSATVQAGIFAVLLDREAAGYAPCGGWTSPTPFNARGGYTNFWVHEREKVWNDHTEKGVVFLLD